MIKDEYLDQIRSGKESISLEFKEASQDIPKNVYDTVCSFSNRNGGNIYLGVADDGMVTGVNPEKILQMKKDFVTAIQSPIKINPPLYLDYYPNYSFFPTARLQQKTPELIHIIPTNRKQSE